jgi:Conserved hypothetical protein (DUF2461)
VREPMAQLLDELSGEFGPGRIARPHRDIWFRADKSPYKTEIYAILDRGGYVRFRVGGLTAPRVPSAVSRCSLIAVAAARLLLPERFSRCCPQPG